MPEVLDQLAAVVADDAAEEDRVRPGLLDLVRERLVARLPSVPALEAADGRDAELLRVVHEQGRDAEAVRLLVGEDVDLLGLERLSRTARVRSALEAVVQTTRA